MSQPIQILGIAGSLRRASYNRAALRAAMQLVPQDTALDIDRDAGIQLFDSGCLEKRDRLGVETLWRQRVKWEACGAYGRFERSHRHGSGAIPSPAGIRLSQYVSD